MKCPCCNEDGIDEGHATKPYLCEECNYITDEVGSYYCKQCDIWMDTTAGWYHSYIDGSHDIVSRSKP